MFTKIFSSANNAHVTVYKHDLQSFAHCSIINMPANLKSMVTSIFKKKNK